MSDTSQGPGWWEASDHKWYPPAGPVASALEPNAPGPPKKPRQWRTWHVVVISVVALFVGVGIGASGTKKASQPAATPITAAVTSTTRSRLSFGTAPPTTPAPPTTTTTLPPTTLPPPPTAPPTVAGPKTSFGDGNYRVGSDIAPGTYGASDPSSSCYWARLRDFTGSGDNIIANDLGTTAGLVTIAADDVGFKTSNCGTWHQI